MPDSMSLKNESTREGGSEAAGACAITGAITGAATSAATSATTSAAAYQKVGIIGGLGPSASARLYQRITDFTDAGCDQDHLDITIFSCPWIPDRTNYLLGVPGAPSFVAPMRELALQLEQLGCEVLATPCNTSHARLDEIAQGLSRARFVSMVDETVRRIAEEGFHMPGILATDGTRAAKVYDKAFAKTGIPVAWPSEENQQLVMSIIYDQVKAGKPADMGMMETVCAQLRAEGCDAVVLACTELSVIGMPQEYGGLRVFDALDILAARVVQAAGARVK